MSEPSIHWIKSSKHELFVSISGSLTAAGELWPATLNLAHGKWKLSLNALRNVQATINPPHYNYDLRMGNMTLVQTEGPAVGYEIYADAFGVSSWMDTNSSPDRASPPYLPRTWGWKFHIVKPASDIPSGWGANYFVTLTRAGKADDFTTWRYMADIVATTP